MLEFREGRGAAAGLALGHAQQTGGRKKMTPFAVQRARRGLLRIVPRACIQVVASRRRRSRAEKEHTDMHRAEARGPFQPLQSRCQMFRGGRLAATVARQCFQRVHAGTPS